MALVEEEHVIFQPSMHFILVFSGCLIQLDGQHSIGIGNILRFGDKHYNNLRHHPHILWDGSEIIFGSTRRNSLIDIIHLE